MDDLDVSQQKAEDVKGGARARSGGEEGAVAAGSPTTPA